MPAGRGPGGALIGLAAATVVLLLVSAVMTALYLRESSARSDRDGTISTLEGQLEQVRAQNVELRAKLTEMETRSIDKGGYDLVKRCVQQGVALENIFAKAMADPNSLNQEEAQQASMAFASSNCTSGQKSMK